jgi:hypothetical protein
VFSHCVDARKKWMSSPVEKALQVSFSLTVAESLLIEVRVVGVDVGPDVVLDLQRRDVGRELGVVGGDRRAIPHRRSTRRHRQGRAGHCASGVVDPDVLAGQGGRDLGRGLAGPGDLTGGVGRRRRRADPEVGERHRRVDPRPAGVALGDPVADRAGGVAQEALAGDQGAVGGVDEDPPPPGRGGVDRVDVEAHHRARRDHAVGAEERQDPHRRIDRGDLGRPADRALDPGPGLDAGAARRDRRARDDHRAGVDRRRVDHDDPILLEQEADRGAEDRPALVALREGHGPHRQAVHAAVDLVGDQLEVVDGRARGEERELSARTALAAASAASAETIAPGAAMPWPHSRWGAPDAVSHIPCQRPWRATNCAKLRSCCLGTVAVTRRWVRAGRPVATRS